MKKILFAAAAAALLASCCNNAPKHFSGTITEASMNTLTVKAADSDRSASFSTMNADKTEAYGLLLGAPVVVDYTGCLKEGTAATKVATNPTYAEAVGRWTMPDPIAEDRVMGIEIDVEGVAQSIDMATLIYRSWELQGQRGRILLRGQSIGNGQTADFTQTGVITKNADGGYTLTIEGTDMVLTKADQM